MPSYTYLEMVDSICQDLNGNENQEIIYTLHQTQQSSFVTRILKETYYQIIDGRDWPHLYQTLQLVQTSSSTPTHMTIPTTVMDFDYVKYNVRTATDTKDKFQKIIYKKPEEFMNILDARDSAATTIDVITDATGIFLNIVNDKAPTYWTSFDDSSVVFDAYDSAVDATNLLTTKTQARGKVYPTVTETNSFVFDLPINAFSFLLAEAKSTAFITLNKEPNQKAEQNSVTQRRRMSSEAHKIDNSIQYVTYGRKSRK